MPAFTLVVSLAITATAAWYVVAAARTGERARFASLTQDARDQATHNLDRYLSALRGTAGLYAAVDSVDRRSFDAYAAALDLPAEYGGLRGIGFAQRVTAGGRAAFLADARRESGPQFSIWTEADPAATAAAAPAVPGPAGDGKRWTDDAFVVRYVAPAVAGRRPVLGYDAASAAERVTAMRRACDAAAAVVTPSLLLVRGPDGERRQGFLIYVPIFGPVGVPESVAARRRAVRGFIFASFRSDDVFRQLINANVGGQLHMRVYEGATAGTGPLLYDSDPVEADGQGGLPRYRDAFVLALAGGQWTVAVSERAGFYTGAATALVPLILLCGAGIGVVLFAVTRSQAVAWQEAEEGAAVFRQSQRALAASQSRLRRLVDANLIGVFFCDLNGEVSGGNDEFFRLLGEDRGGDGRPLRLADLAQGEGRAWVEQALRQVGRDGSCPAFETAFVRRHGEAVPVLLGLAAASTAGDVEHIAGAETVAFALDLTDRHRAEADLRRAMEAAERANRSKDQFLAMLSHELRTPLTPVLAATAGSATDASLPAGVRDDLAMIHRNVELEARLIDDLLDLTRVGRGKLRLRLEVVDVNRVIADAVAVVPVDDVAGKGLTVEQDLSAGSHHVSGDAARLQQVFWNLLKNAVKFTPEGGRITIRTANIGGGLPGLRVEVVDTGLGIEPEVLPRLFDAFEQGSSARAQASGGLGLGLAISRGLVEAHGGRITARSGGAGQGSTFTVDLTTVPAPAGAAAGTPAAAVDVPTVESLRLLLVEDHADTARVLARLLTRAGHTVTVAHSVAEAARASEAGRFDVLVSDLGLPDGSGTEVVIGFRRRHGHRQANGRPVGAVALTGFGAEDDVARTRAAGFDEHLTKPVAFDLLRAAIGRVAVGTAAGAVG